MKRRMTLLLMSVIWCLCSCNTQADTSGESTEPLSNLETETQTLEAKAVIVDAQASSSRISYAGKAYVWGNVQIVIPEEWDGKYVLKESEDDLVFYQKSSNDKDVTMGWLCTISIRNEYYNDIPGNTLIAYTNEGEYYYLSVPTDVTFFADNEEIAEEYMRMQSQCEWIAGSMSSTETALCFDANQYVLLTSSISPIEEYQIMNLSNNSLWIARNEIYARHGKIFTNAYLDSYFRTCSWYHPVDGKI